MPGVRGYDPEPLDVPPIFASPPRPLAMLRWTLTRFLWPQSLCWIAVSVLVYHLFTPGLARFESLSVDDVALLWGRNAALMLVVIGGLHWRLHIRRAQGADFKYDKRPLAKGRKAFLFADQTRDNMFYSLVSGGGVMALYEAVMFRLYATESLPQLGSLWAIAAMTFAVFWIEGVHFYANHRLLHVEPLYRWFHALHHRNVNTGPWSGISMHPFEHLLYFSLPLVFLVVPGSPFVVTFSLVYLALGAAASHSGFDRFKVGRRADVHGGDFFHNLHHRCFEVNYGMLLVPLDKWLGTYHDGSAEAHERFMQRKQVAARAEDAGDSSVR